MKKLEQFLTKKEESLSSTQIRLPYLLSREIVQWGEENVPADQIFVAEDGWIGLEKEIHITVPPGIHDATPFRVQRLIEQIQPFEIELGKVSIFKEDEKFDVLKISAYSNKLNEVNETLKNCPHIDSKCSFNPHITIAYLKKGGEWKYGNEEQFIGRRFRVDEMVFIAKAEKRENRKKTIIQLSPELRFM